MESMLTTKELDGWTGLKDEEIVKRIHRCCDAAGTQAAFSFDSAFKGKVADVIVGRWPNASSALRTAFLQLTRIMARDPKNVQALLPEKLIASALNSSGLPEVCDADTTEEEQEEAVKCLCNALYHSRSARKIFLDTKSDRGLISAIAAATETKDSVRRYLLLHVAFVVSAYEKELQEGWRRDNCTMTVLTKILKDWRTDPRCVDEAQKTIFNIVCHSRDAGREEMSESASIALCESCVAAIRELPKGNALVQGIINILACLMMRADVVCPPEGPESSVSYDGLDMTVPQAVSDDLEAKLGETTNDEYNTLGTYLTFLLHIASDCKEARRHLRLITLPPLHASDVERPPEAGTTIRNKLVRVMQSNSQVRELAAKYLFVLCKRSVNRLIKYTGFGHSAGMLANSGLLGAINEAKRASDSEDSETEDYVEVEDRVNPVTGYMRDPTARSALDEMSEEQKEYEAHKLAEALDKLLSSGVIKPASIGEDGKPKEVSHVLELLKGAKTPEDTDSDE